MPVMKPLTVHEWLEQERASGLPHADFAADALLVLDEKAHNDEAWDNLLDRINTATGDVVDSNDQIVECFKFRDKVLCELVDAGLIDDTDVPLDQMSGLLRMFLPC